MENERLGYSPEQQEKTKVVELGDFDMKYFLEIAGEDRWIAIGQENCKNQQYFTVIGEKGEKLGVVGAYDTVEDQNITHTVVDPKFRGQGLAGKFKDQLMEKLDLPFLTMTIDLGNVASLKATGKLPGVKRVSDAEYEQDFHKAKFVYENQIPNKSID